MKAVGHGDTTSADELRRAGKELLGGVTVCAADEIPQRTAYVIANLSERGDGPGTHWVCRCHGVWHDPLGMVLWLSEERPPPTDTCERSAM